MTITALRQSKRDTLAKASAINAHAESQGRALTDAEQLEINGYLAEAKTLDAQIATKEALMDAERTAPAAAAIDAVVGQNNAERKPWKSLGENLQAVVAGTKALQSGRHALVDPRLYGALGANETVPAEGGFLVAPEYANEILQKSYDEGEVAKRCDTMPMSSSRTIINAVDESSRVDGSRYGGIQAYWLAEGQTYTGTKPKFREVQLVANKLIGLCYATEEQLEDGPQLESYIRKAFPQEFAFKIDDAIINGKGAGQPLGVLNSGALITQSKDSGQATGTVSAANIENMWSRLFAPNRKNACWFINQSVEPQLFTLTIPGQNGTAQALYVRPGGYGNTTEYATIFGKPVIPIEQTSNLSSLGDIILGDMSAYLLAKRSDMRADTSIHVAFLTGEQAFRFQLRLDGQTWWNKPLTPKATSAPTLSPFVTLQAR